MRRILFCLSLLALLASLLGAAAVIHQHSVQTFGAISGLPDPSLDPRPNPLAVNVALEQYADLDPVLDSLAGFHWLRQTFPWDEIEPARDEFHWEKWDAIVAKATAHHKEIIAVLNYSPVWARGTGVQLNAPRGRTAPPQNPANFAAFASAFAARYADRIDIYQIWDEPNLLLGWGDQPPSAAEYAALLQAAYTAIHAADPHATVMAAALAPTVETGLDNISDLLYLQQLYDLSASQSFDAAAGKPYGLYTGPDDRRADRAILNFSRFTLLRQVMEKNGDGHKLLWGGNFGWNVLDNTPWGKATPEQQEQYTRAAYQRTMDEWPWAGPLALENYQPAPSPEGDLRPPDDPHWGFALADPTDQPSPLLQTLNSYGRSVERPSAIPGNHTAFDPAARYFGNWEFSDLGADIPQDYANARIEISFSGTDLALKVRRGDYRAYLYVEIDGQPANLLPRDARGAYLVLTSPDLRPEVATLPVASGLAHDRTHTAVIYPERGWDQWAFAGFSVGRQLPITNYRIALGLLMTTTLLSALGVWRFGRGLAWGGAGAKVRAAWERLGATGQLVLTMLVGGLLYLASWLTFGDDMISFTRRFGDTTPILLTALTAGLFYFSPSFVIALAALAALFILFYLRLDLALAFVTLFIPFYLFPRMLWERGASMLEFTLWLTLAAWLFRNIRPLLARLKTQGTRLRKQSSNSILAFNPSSFFLHPSSLDFALLAFVLVSALSTFAAERHDVALYEFRTVILGSALYYGLLRATPLDRRALWRIVDFFLLGALAVAAIGLYQYVTRTDLITAEEGVARIHSVYGSPNNLALYLGRALPIAVAVALIGGLSATRSGHPPRGAAIRPILYAFAALILGYAIFLTRTRGALLLGVPVSLALIVILWLGRRGVIVVGAAITAGLASLPLLSRLPRFGAALNFGSGTSFFRVKLWVSAFRMFRDHPLLGVGPDNFLYQYRSRYILPEAWQDPNLSHPHNIALDYLSRLGLLGFATGLWIHLAFWRTAIYTYRRLKMAHPSPIGDVADGGRAGDGGHLLPLCIGLMASVADMLAHGLVDHSFFLIDLAFTFCLTLALVQQLGQLAEQGEERAHGKY